MVNLPKVSVVIITLNEEKNIGNLLECLLRQSHKDFEVVIVDSNSSDSTNDIVERYRSKFKEFKTYQLGFAKGPAYGRNKGAELASYEELLFMDSDTLIDNEFLEKLLMEKVKKNIEVAGIKFGATKNENLSLKIAYKFVNGVMVAFQIVRPKASASCLSSTKRVHDFVGGFDPDIRILEDCAYISQTRKNAKFRVIDVYHYFNNRRVGKEGRASLVYKYVVSHLIRDISRREIRDDKLIKYAFGHY